MKMTMKKYLSMAVLALAGAMMSGCGNEDDFANDSKQQPANVNNVVTLTTTVGLGEGATNRAMGEGGTNRALAEGGVKTFGADDQMAVIYKNTSGGTVKAVGTLASGAGTKSGTFTFTLTNPDNSKAIRYIYPAAMAKDVTTDATIDDAGTVDFGKLNNQDGTLATLGSKLDLCTLDAASWTSGTLPTGTLENQLAILAITLKNEDGSDDITDDITGMTVSDGTNTYTVNRAAVAGPIYVAILPTSGATINVTAIDGYKNYTKSLTGKTYEANNGYNVSWRMTETPYYDPENREILDGAIISWLGNNNFTQANINNLGNDEAATGKLYECYLCNCAITAENPGATVSIIKKTVNEGYVSLTVQLTRNNPLGCINGVLYIYVEGSETPISEEHVSFEEGDQIFDTVPVVGSLTQTVVAKIYCSDIGCTGTENFEAKIDFPQPEEEPWEPEPEPDPEE